MNWRLALVLGAAFIVVGTTYWVLQYAAGTGHDLSGVTFLIVLGVAMAFGFTILLRGSRDL